MMLRSSTLNSLLAAVVGVVICQSLFAGDWAQFRGGTSLSHAVSADSRADWLKENALAWRVEIPGAGLSQPILYNGAIYVTTAVGNSLPKLKGMQGGVIDPSTMGKPQVPKEKLKFQLLRINPRDGSIEWTRTVAEKQPTAGTHASNSYATETPCAAEGRIYAYFGTTGDLAAFNEAGEELWNKSFGPQPIQNQFGTGASPVWHEGRLFIPRFNEKEGTILCLRGDSGEEAWTAAGTAGTSWATPVVWSHRGEAELVTAGQGAVISFDVATGQERWRVGGLDTSFSCSVVADDQGVYFGTSSPGSKGPIYAIAPGKSGDLTLLAGQTQSDAILWSKTKSGAGMPSPVVVGDLLFFFGNTVVCYEKSSGRELYRKRMPEGHLAAGCPLVVGDKLVVVNERGQLLIFSAGREFTEPAGFQVGTSREVFWATPALADQTLLVRSSEALYCFRGTE